MILVSLPLPPYPVYRLRVLFKATEPVTAICSVIKGTIQTGKRRNRVF